MNKTHEELCEKAIAAICAVVNDEAASPAEIVKFLDELAEDIDWTSKVFKGHLAPTNEGQARIDPKGEHLDEEDTVEGCNAGDLIVYAVYDVAHRYKGRLAPTYGGQARIGPKREHLDEGDTVEGWNAGDLTVSAVYDVKQKGRDDFQMQVWDADGPWVYGALVAGNLEDWRRLGIDFGNKIAVRRCYCTFTLAAGSEAPAKDT